MKKFFVVFCLLLLVCSTTIVIATKDNMNVKKGDEFLKDSFAKLEDVGNKSVLEMFGEFFKKGSPTLSQADKNRLIINLLIFSCIANVGICVYILKKDKKVITTIVNTGDKDVEIGLNNKRQIIKDIRKVDCRFKESVFVKKIITSIILIEETKNSKNREKIKNIVTEEFFQELEKQFQHNTEEGLVEKSEKLKVKDVQLARFFRGKNFDTIVALAKVSKIQYWTNMEGDKIIKGSIDTLTEAYYKMSFVRSKSEENLEENSCECNNSSEFAYKDWTLNVMKSLK